MTGEGPAREALPTALELDKPPWRWSRQDLAIDVVDKLVLAEATGAIYGGFGGRGK